jgi:hypothetical protein
LRCRSSRAKSFQVLESVVKYYMGKIKGSHTLPDVKRVRVNLAILLREAINETLILDWFKMILSGRNPVLVEDRRVSGGLRVAEDPHNRIATSSERRDQAMRQLLDRRDGLPPQRMQLEAEIRSTTTHTVISAAELAQLPPQQLGAVVSALRAAMAPPTPPPEEPLMLVAA